MKKKCKHFLRSSMKQKVTDFAVFRARKLCFVSGNCVLYRETAKGFVKYLLKYFKRYKKIPHRANSRWGTYNWIG